MVFGYCCAAYGTQEYTTPDQWPILCFLKEDEAEDFCNSGDALIEEMQRIKQDHFDDENFDEKINQVFQKLIRIDDAWEDYKDEILHPDNYTCYFFFEKAPIQKTSDVIESKEVVSKPGAAIKVEKVRLTPKASKGLCIQRK